MQIATINLNGIRAAERKGFTNWLENSQVDLVLGQETRAPVEKVAEIFGENWETITAPCDIAGRAGVCIAVRKSSGWKIAAQRSNPVPIEVPADTGRWIEADLISDTPSSNPSSNPTKLTVASVYLHSGEVNTEKQAQKMSHLSRVDEYLNQITTPYYLMAGDFNIVHTEKDIKNWKPNHNKRAGVLDEEIAYLDKWFTEKWVDVTRHLVGPEQTGPYSWWSWRGKAFDNDAGWRIDYHLASRALAETAQTVRVDRAEQYDQRFSDHAPVVVDYRIS